MGLPEILVLDRGFVLVGRTREDKQDYLSIVVDDCCAVRRWGTERGLGQLARDGILPNTVLDYEGDGVTVNLMYVLRRIPCGERWQSWSPK